MSRLFYVLTHPSTAPSTPIGGKSKANERRQLTLSSKTQGDDLSLDKASTNSSFVSHPNSKASPTLPFLSFFQTPVPVVYMGKLAAETLYSIAEYLNNDDLRRLSWTCSHLSLVALHTLSARLGSPSVPPHLPYQYQGITRVFDCAVEDLDHERLVFLSTMCRSTSSVPFSDLAVRLSDNPDNCKLEMNALCSFFAAKCFKGEKIGSFALDLHAIRNGDLLTELLTQACEVSSAVDLLCSGFCHDDGSSFHNVDVERLGEQGWAPPFCNLLSFAFESSAAVKPDIFCFLLRVVQGASLIHFRITDREMSAVDSGMLISRITASLQSFIFHGQTHECDLFRFLSHQPQIRHLDVPFTVCTEPAFPIGRMTRTRPRTRINLKKLVSLSGTASLIQHLLSRMSAANSSLRLVAIYLDFDPGDGRFVRDLGQCFKELSYLRSCRVIRLILRRVVTWQIRNSQEMENIQRLQQDARLLSNVRHLQLLLLINVPVTGLLVSFFCCASKCWSLFNASSGMWFLSFRNFLRLISCSYLFIIMTKTGLSQI